MKVYLASRYSRHPEMQGYRDELAELGIEVTSRWINGGHEWVSVPDEEMPVSVGEDFAREDLLDLIQADVVVNFTEPPKANPSRGGRHVEFGYALGQGIDVLVVGHRENVFHCLLEVAFVETWEEAKQWLIEERDFIRSLEF